MEIVNAKLEVVRTVEHSSPKYFKGIDCDSIVKNKDIEINNIKDELSKKKKEVTTLKGQITKLNKKLKDT